MRRTPIPLLLLALSACTGKTADTAADTAGAADGTDGADGTADVDQPVTGRLALTFAIDPDYRDLMQEEGRPGSFLARKVFRGASALAAHEASAHFRAWQQRVARALEAVADAPALHATLHPRTSYAPFRSRWAS